nr:hypothetical protein [Acholeplasmatales bacterium]
MRINCFKTNEKYPKITTYHIVMNNKSILLDYGVELKNKDFINSIDYIFISHEHGDHVGGLLSEYKLLSDNVKIFMTNTVKEILSHRTEVVFREFLEKHVVTLCFDEPIKEDDIKITYYQAGHTFGSACIFLEGEYSMFYTGDINYATFDHLCTYDIPYSLETDYLILDGTSLSKETEFKKLSLSHLKKDAPKFKKYYINATPDKAVFIGKYLSQTFPDIYYEADLKDYLETVMNAGYEPFCNDKIGYDNEERYKNESGIYISSTLFSEFNKNFVLSLHISSNDIKEFLYKFKRADNVLIGHCYGLDEEDGFTILKEGSNEV